VSRIIAILTWAICSAAAGGTPSGPATRPGDPPADLSSPRARAERAVDVFVNEQDYQQIGRQILVWDVATRGEDRNALMVALLRRVRSDRFVGLKDYADFSVESRVKAGKMDFPGHGTIAKQDVFLEGGRSAVAIEVLTGRTLTPIVEGMKPAERQQAFEDACFAVIESR
jgi:hypothetical protein